MKFRFLSFLIIAIIISGTFLPFRVKAVSSIGILANTVPENPAPGEKVNITLKSYNYDLNSVLISWSVNGKTVSSEIGKGLFLLMPQMRGRIQASLLLSLLQTERRTLE